MDPQGILEAIFSILIGLIIGMERERAGRGRIIGGVRTLPLVSLLGYLTYYISEKFKFFIYFSLLGTFSLATISYYVFKAATTTISFILVYFLGVLVGINIEFSLFLSVVVVSILSVRRFAHKFVRKIKRIEWTEFIEFLIISAILYPLMPNMAIDPMGIFVPSKVLLIVVLVSALNFVGYILSKMFGERGIVISGMFGGVTSSTAVTMSISSISRKKRISTIGASAITSAIAVMFLRIPIVTSFVNVKLAAIMLPAYLSSFFIGIIFSLYYYIRSEKKELETFIERPFNIGGAIKFGIIFGIVLIISNFAKARFGRAGLYVISSISGIPDINAINLSIANLEYLGRIYVKDALFSILLAFTMNNIFKILIAYSSDKKMGKLILPSVIAMTVPEVVQVIYFGF